LVDYLESWLKEHIDEKDRALADYAKQQLDA
jgi:hemerythrin